MISWTILKFPTPLNVEMALVEIKADINIKSLGKEIIPPWLFRLHYITQLPLVKFISSRLSPRSSPLLIPLDNSRRGIFVVA